MRGLDPAAFHSVQWPLSEDINRNVAAPLVSQATRSGSGTTSTKRFISSIFEVFSPVCAAT